MPQVSPHAGLCRAWGIESQQAMSGSHQHDGLVSKAMASVRPPCDPAAQKPVSARSRSGVKQAVYRLRLEEGQPPPMTSLHRGQCL